jgi:hypothetical protein
VKRILATQVAAGRFIRKNGIRVFQQKIMIEELDENNQPVKRRFEWHEPAMIRETPDAGR